MDWRVDELPGNSLTEQITRGSGGRSPLVSQGVQGAQTPGIAKGSRGRRPLVLQGVRGAQPLVLQGARGAQSPGKAKGFGGALGPPIPKNMTCFL